MTATTLLTTAGRQTQLLILLLIASAVAAGFAYSRLNSARDDAIASLRDRVICISEMSAITAGSGTDKASANDDVVINRRLRAAAVAAHLADQLASIDAGNPASVRNSDYIQTPIYLRLNGVSLKQLVGFLYELSITDNSLRSSDIELSLPLTASPNRSDPGDLWTADVTLSLASYQQRQPSESR